MHILAKTTLKQSFLLQLSLIFLFVLFISSCERETFTPTTFESGEKIRIFNHTGHLVAQSSDRCGKGIQAKFVLTSNEEVKEYIFDADTFGTGVIKVKKGENLTIQVFEAESSNPNPLVTRRVTYNPTIQPTMILCPKDFLDIKGF